jgi:hypothetical protein
VPSSISVVAGREDVQGTDQPIAHASFRVNAIARWPRPVRLLVFVSCCSFLGVRLKRERAAAPPLACFSLHAWAFEEGGHRVTVGTYTHVIRELKGQPVMAAEDQIEQARREDGGRLVDVDAV